MSWWISRATLCTGESLAGGAGEEAKPKGSQGDTGGPVRPLEPV